MRTIKLQSSDGVRVEVDEEVIQCSQTIKDMMDTLDTNEREDILLPTPNIKASTLQTVVDWAYHHKDDMPLPAPSGPGDPEDEDKEISPCDQKFVNGGYPILHNLLLAAYFLDIQPLVTLGCKAVAKLIQGKSPEELRELFQIDVDLTEADIAQIEMENEWIAHQN